MVRMKLLQEHMAPSEERVASCINYYSSNKSVNCLMFQKSIGMISGYWHAFSESDALDLGYDSFI